MESFALLEVGMKPPHINRTFRGTGTKLRAGEGVLCPVQPGNNSS